MGWHMEGTPSTPSALNFVDPVLCFYCHQVLAPTDAYCYWGGGSIAKEAADPPDFDPDKHDTWPKLIIADGHIYLHPKCALVLSETLIKDALLADHYGTKPFAGQVGRQV